MRTQCAIFIGIGLFAALGCSRVQHSFHPYQPVGTALPVEVAVKHKDSEPVSGIVYHRMAGAGAYQATPCNRRIRLSITSTSTRPGGSMPWVLPALPSW